MGVQPCPQKITCPDCLDFPIENFSAEAPDEPTFVSVYHHFQDPPIGHPWNRTGCIGICFSTISQAAADLCALQQAQLCLDDDDCAGDICGGWGEPVPGDSYSPSQVFRSNQQTCSLLCPDGNLTVGFVLPFGSVISLISQVDADIRAAALCEKTLKQQIFEKDVCDGLPKACFTAVDEYEFQFPQAGGSPPWVYAIVSGSMSGLTLESNGFLHGFPAISGLFPYVIQATDQLGAQRVFSGTFIVIEITNVTPLPTGPVNVVYSELLAQTGGTPPGTWQIISGALPTGLTLDTSTGLISGTPTSIGTFNFVVEFTDSSV